MDARERLLAAADLSATTPTAAARVSSKWSERTAKEYLVHVTTARQWWDTDRREARAEAARAGLQRVPDGRADAFMPWSSDRLVRYVTYMCERGSAPQTIRKAMSSLKAWHRLQGHPVPDTVPALDVLQTHEDNRLRAGIVPKRAEPINLDMALRLLSGLDRKTPAGRRDAVVLMVAYTCMTSVSTLSELNLGDVTATTDGFTLRRGGDGDTPVRVHHWQIGGQHSTLVCPVEAVLGWCDELTGRGAGPGTPLIRGVDRYDNIAGFRLPGDSDTRTRFAGPIDPEGRVTPERIGRMLWRICEQAGIGPDERRPTMSELRLGGIVKRRMDGATVDQLAAESGSDTLLRFVRLVEQLSAADN